ncbi:hemerythrin domain-containing protein [Sphingomonas sp. RB3P16]|uniref:hemerythrin domain-containing protein n=1 Tax=Parasphingomonas frigoris TaxID=3096163 RepID=UPI002FC6B4A0
MPTSPIALPLSDRVGVPAEIAYLRAAYPAPQWRSHRNYGELSAFWLSVHASLREQGGQVQQVTAALREGRIDPAAFQSAFVPRFNHFLQHLTGHHQIEDHAYFPKFRALDPRMVAGFDLLENDHAVIDATLHETVEQARALLAALGQPGDARLVATDRFAGASDHLMGLLARHLADEEDLVLPAMLEHGERSVS